MTKKCCVFQTRHCDDLNIPGSTSSSLFLFIGVFAACGRIGGGILCDLPRINSRCLYQSSVFVVGASTGLLTVAKTYGSLVAYAITFGTADGIMISTHIIQTLKLVGETERASAIGFWLMLAGIFSLGSPPLSGKFPFCSTLFSPFLLCRRKFCHDSLIAQTRVKGAQKITERERMRPPFTEERTVNWFWTMRLRGVALQISTCVPEEDPPPTPRV